MKRASYLYNQRLTGGEQEFSCSSQLQSSMVELEFVFGLRNLVERRLITVLIYVVKKRSMGAPSFSLLCRSDEIGNPSCVSVTTVYLYLTSS